jgi:hypothetical protein
MSSIGFGSVPQLAASVARSIAGNESLAPSKTELRTPPAVGDSMKSAFDGLIRTHQSDAAHPPAPLGLIAPFTPPHVPAGTMIGTIQEAISSFRDIAGLKQRAGDPLDAQRVGLEFGQQKTVPELGQQRVGGEENPAFSEVKPGSAPALRSLDDLHNLFGLLAQIVAGDQAISSKPNQVLR